MRATGSRVAYQNPWITVREDTLAYPDGSTGLFGVVEKPDFALVVPAENDGFWMVEQWRYAVGLRSWEFPQGSWPVGWTGDRTDLEGLARAELREETGLTADNLTHLATLAPNYGLVANMMHVYLATGLTPGEPEREISEADMVHRFVTEAEFLAMVRDGRCVDAHSVAAYSLYRMHLSPDRV